MKKVLALIIAVITVAAMFAFSFNASAAAGKDPTFTADKNLIVGQTDASKGYTGATWYFGQGAGSLTNCYDKSYGTVNAITAQLGTSGAYATAGGLTYLQIANARAVSFARDGSEADNDLGKVMGMFIHISDTPVKMNSCILAGPAIEHFLHGNMPDAFDIYIGDVAYRNEDKLEAYQSNIDHFKLAVSAKNLVTDGKYVNSADGSFSYYEVNFDKEMEGTDLAFWISRNGYQTVSAAKTAGTTNVATVLFSELAVFADKIPTENKPSDKTGDTSMLLGMILAGAVALTASVIVIRKKEENV